MENGTAGWIVVGQGNGGRKYATADYVDSVTWTTDRNRAKRFPSREKAQAVIDRSPRNFEGRVWKVQEVQN